MSGPYVVGIDCGSQSAKVVVYDAAGRPVASGQQPLRPMLRPRHGVVLHPDDDLWDATAAACRAALAGFTGDPAEIVGIGLCPIRCCKAFLGDDGELVEPVMSWMDERAYQPYLPDHAASDHAAAIYATTASGYLGHKLTGAFVDSAANNIDLQWPIDIDTWRWSDDPAAFQRHGVARHMLFELVDPGDVIGPLSGPAAGALGLPAGVPVVATANDKAVEMLGTGAIGPTTALLSMGTYICAMVHGDRPRPASPRHWTNFSSIPGRYLHESTGIRRGMWTLTWLLDLLGPEFAERAASERISREERLEQEARHTPAGSDGLMAVLDWLAPDSAAYRKGSWLGFDARHTRGHLYRSIVEAIAMTMHQHTTAMCAELEIELDDVVVSGGGSCSDLLMQVLADAFDLPAWRAVGGGASLGAAICAAVAAGLHPDFETAVAAMAPARQRFEPITSNAAVYRQVAPLYADLRGATDPIYQRADALVDRPLDQPPLVQPDDT